MEILAGILSLFLVEAKVIDYDPGGYIYQRSLVVPLEYVEIRGYCASACTMHLANGCVYPDATLVFHGPLTDDKEKFDYFSQLMASHYPPSISIWYMEEGRFGEYQFKGYDIIRYGAEECN